MIRILDSTLREGEQAPGVYFTPESKLHIATLLDEVGVDIIEAGNPSVDPQIAEAVKVIAGAGLKARIGAHARCRIDDVQKALDCGPTFLGVFLGVSEARLQKDYRLTLPQALGEIGKVISHARKASNSLQIRFTVEDAVRTPFNQMMEAAIVAVEAGADIISVADTTGFTNPFMKERSIAQTVRRVKEELARRNLEPEIEVHCHNDRGLALANGLDAGRAGATIIDAAVLGLGERAGIIDLAELLLNLRETFQNDGAPVNFRSLAGLYEVVSKHARVPISVNRPVMGKHVFTHSAGVHIKALSQDPELYESLRPESFGRTREFTLGVQSGRASIELALTTIGRGDLIKNKTLISKLVAEVKALTREGLTMNLDREFPALVERLIDRRSHE